MSESNTSSEVEVSIPPIPLGPPAEPWVSEITEPTTGALQRLEAEVAALDKAYHWAKAMSKTEMVPEVYQYYSKPRGSTDIRGDTATYNLAAAVLYGSEIGLSAMASAQNVFVVYGKPAVYARTMAAQVRRAGYQIQEIEASDTKVVWQGLRDGRWASSEWTIERATQAGYTSNDKYRTNPQEMLRAKAIAEVCRIQYQDVLLGMAYSVEELQLDQVTVTRPVKEGVRGTAKLREIAEAAAKVSPAAAVGGHPPQDGAPAPDTPSQPPAGEPPTEEQLDRIRALGKAKGLTASVLLEEVTLFLQKEKRLPSLHKLTAEEADAVIASMTVPENEPEQGPSDG